MKKKELGGLTIVNNKDFLNHYGVLGMKWGRRKLISSPVGAIRKKLDENKAKRIEKKSERQFKKAKDGSIDNFINANNHAAKSINGKWLDDFNKKWEPRFKDVDNWQDSPNWKPYIKEYSDNLVRLMNEKPTKVQLANGKTLVQKYLSENDDAAISWVWQEKK